MTDPTPAEGQPSSPFAAAPVPALAAAGAAGLAAVVMLLPFLGDETVALPEQILSYVLAVVPSGVLVLGLLALFDGRVPRTPRLLLLGAASSLAGALAVYLGGRPDDLAAPAVPPLALLLLADVLRIAAATALALALARNVASPAAAIVAVPASASDLFSVFTGPTKALVREDAPVVDFLLLIFPTFGYPLGSALGTADFVFLALFVAVAGYLALKPLATLALGCLSILLAMLAGLLLGAALPALPFISLSFLAANARPLYRALLGDREPL